MVIEGAQHPVCPAANGPTSSPHAIMMHLVVAEDLRQHRQCARHGRSMHCVIRVLRTDNIMLKYAK